MSTDLERSSSWLYEGIWGVLTRFFRVPRKPPTLPTGPDEKLDQFRPAPGYLSYQMLKFKITMFALGFALVAIVIILSFIEISLGALAGFLLLPLFIAVSIGSWLATHLHYDSIWYVLGPRSMRIRRGIWTIKDITLTYENVQNVNANQGPIERFFGISNLRVDTAGGGSPKPEEAATLSAHVGLIEGVDNPKEIRELILGHLQNSKGAGLGDDFETEKTTAWTLDHLEALRDIRDVLKFRNPTPQSSSDQP